MADIDWIDTPEGRQRRPHPETDPGPGRFYFPDRPLVPISGNHYAQDSTIAAWAKRQGRRLHYLKQATLNSLPITYNILESRFQNIPLQEIWPALKAMCAEMVEIIATGTVLGGAVGAIGGPEAIVPGAILGTKTALWYLSYKGLTELVGYIEDALLPALRSIGAGIQTCWHAADDDEFEPSAVHQELYAASWQIGNGNAEIATAILVGLAAILVQKGSVYTAKLIAKSNLGNAGKEWFEQNSEKLRAWYLRQNLDGASGRNKRSNSAPSGASAETKLVTNAEKVAAASSYSHDSANLSGTLRDTDTGKLPVKEPIPTIAPQYAQGGASPPYKLKTTPLDEQWHGEHLPGNKQWNWVGSGGSQVRYLSAEQREAFALTIDDGKFYNAKGNLFDTSGFNTTWSGAGRAIYVMDEQGKLYATSHRLGEFHHSSFLAGAPVAAAGEMEVHSGILQVLSDKSGHYLPKKEFTNQAINVLKDKGVDMTYVSIEYNAPK